MHMNSLSDLLFKKDPPIALPSFYVYFVRFTYGDLNFSLSSRCNKTIKFIVKLLIKSH